jgi:hypothetical protein
MSKKPLRKCDVCGSLVDIYTNCHAKNKFIDYKFYEKVCFTCYHVPKIIYQKYDKEGLLVEQNELEYCCDNLNTPKELLLAGSADNLKEAKKSFESVFDLCKKVKKNKLKITKPQADWKIV